MILRLDNPEDRIKALEERLQQYPASAAFFPLASLLWEKGEAEYAENLLKNGLATYPNYAAAGVLLGEILISKGEYEQASRFLAKSLEIVPWNISGQLLLSQCYRQKGDEEATQAVLGVADMFQADEVTPRSVVTDSYADDTSVVVPEDESDALATPALAELYFAQGHLGMARDIYVRLLESGPAQDEKVEWNERLAAIQEQISQGGEVDVPTGYPGMEANLDLIAGEVKGEADVPDKAESDVVTPDEIDPDIVDAETSPPGLEKSAGDSSPVAEMLELDEEERESGPSSEEPVAVNEELVDSFLRELVELYVQEENDAQALDVCRKAQVLGRDDPWILEKISVLEQKKEILAVSQLRHEAEEATDPSDRIPALADQKVVDTLKGWLETLQRRKANA